MTRAAFRNMSIARRLMTIGLLTTAVALLSVSIVLVAQGAMEWRNHTAADLKTTATMIGANAAPAMVFDDRRAAAETLSALGARPSIVVAAIYDRNGKLFASFRPASSREVVPEVMHVAGGNHEFSSAGIVVWTPITFQGEVEGTIYLRSDLSEIYANLLRNAGLVFLAALLAFSAGSALFISLQRSIVAPIRGLADAMQGVATEKNYGLRVPVESGDEVGTLAAAFNTMLEAVQQRDAALALHGEELEQEVARRTAELRQANELLGKELTVRKQAEEALQRHTGQIELVSQLLDFLQTCLAAEEVYLAAGRFMARLIPEGSGALYALNNSRNLLESSAHWGERQIEHPVFAPNDCWAVRRGQPHAYAPDGTAPPCAHAGHGTGFSLCIPMTAQGEVIGLLHLQTAGAGISNSEQTLVGRVGGEVAQALANLKLRDALKIQAIRDPLTGLYNRRYLLEYLEMELARTRRRGGQLSVVMMDIDHFKRFNDTFGHDAGDAVLRELGAFLSSSVREGDAACRYGGEEFIIAMWETTIGAAQQRANELREAIKHLQVRLGAQPLGSIAVSMGVAAFPDHGSTPAELISAADRALYAAKGAGRDRVCLAQGSPA